MIHQQALDYCHQSLDLHRKLGDSPSQADTWDALGFAHHHLGDSDAAMACYEKALGLWRELGDRYEVATTTLRMGNTQHTAGDLQAARKLWSQARIILDELGHSLGEQLSAWLVTSSVHHHRRDPPCLTRRTHSTRTGARPASSWAASPPGQCSARRPRACRPLWPPTCRPRSTSSSTRPSRPARWNSPASGAAIVVNVV